MCKSRYFHVDSLCINPMGSTGWKLDFHQQARPGSNLKNTMVILDMLLTNSSDTIMSKVYSCWVHSYMEKNRRLRIEWTSL